MELYKEILARILEKEKIYVNFPDLTFSLTEALESKCYKALQKIKAIIENDSLDDFMCIEEIVCVLENLGSDGGGRHDFT